MRKPFEKSSKDKEPKGGKEGSKREEKLDKMQMPKGYKMAMKKGKT